MTTPHYPRCTLAPPRPVLWLATVMPRDGFAWLTFELEAVTPTDAIFTALELAGRGSRVRRVQRQGEWA